MLRGALTAATEEADNRILECAVAGRVEIVVTGDKGLLQLGTFEGIEIISQREYLSGSH